VVDVAGEADAARTPWSEATIIVSGAFTAMLASTALNPAVPVIAQRFGVAFASAQWLSSGYLLALAVGVPVSGWASRRLGATRLWLVGLAAFAALSVACAVAHSFPILLCCRLLQGLAGGILVPAGQTVLGLLAGQGRLGRMMSVTGIAVVVAPALGTSVGGLLIARADWSWLFWLDVPLCVVALIAGVMRLPAVERGTTRSLDWCGLVLSVVGLGLLVYGATAVATDGGLDRVGPASCVGLGVFALAMFTWRSLRSPMPLLDVRLFSNGVFAAGSAVMALGGAINFGAQVVLPMYFVDVRAENVALAGVLIAPQVVGTAIGFPIAGRLTDRGGAGVLLVIGALLTAVATIPLAVVDERSGYVWLGIVLFVRGLGVALSTIPAMTVALATAEANRLPDATALLNVLQRIGASLGAALAAVVYSRHVAGVGAAAAAAAFRAVNWWLVGGAGLLAIASYFVVRSERHQQINRLSRSAT
jgi:EmrB/QacA subfamily drug resistance transporter